MRQPETFGAVVARLREAKGWTRYRLAKTAGLSPVHLTRLEQGEQQPGLAVADRVARALGVSLSTFDGCSLHHLE